MNLPREFLIQREYAEYHTLNGAVVIEQAPLVLIETENSWITRQIVETIGKDASKKNFPIIEKAAIYYVATQLEFEPIL